MSSKDKGKEKGTKPTNLQEAVEAESNEIVNYFMDKGATVSVKDYDYIKSSLLRIAKEAEERCNEQLGILRRKYELDNDDRAVKIIPPHIVQKIRKEAEKKERGNFKKWAEEHYWDSQDKDIVLLHLNTYFTSNEKTK